MIELIELEKSFDDIRAVNRVTLNVSDGEVFGLVGTNGAGKSTILSRSNRDSCSATSPAGRSLDTPTVRARMGWASPMCQ